MAKHILGDNWEIMRALRHSDTARLLSSAPHYPVTLLKQFANRPFFPFDIVGHMGMGAVLTTLVKLLKFAETHSLAPVCRATNQLYCDVGEDIFSEYLAFNADFPISRSEQEKLRFHELAHEKTFSIFGVPSEMSLEEANRIFFKYFNFADCVTNVVDEFMCKIGLSEFDVGIHYRGTDKRSEAPVIGFCDTLAVVEKVLPSKKMPTIFLATDNAAFAAIVRERFVCCNVVSFEYGLNLDPTIPRHFSNMSPREKALDALVNIILLSNAKVCVRTSSHFSAWSRILNRNMKQITLNRPYKEHLFPEKQLWEESLSICGRHEDPISRLDL